MNVKLTCLCSSNQATPPRQLVALLGFQVVLGSRLLLWIVFVLLSVVFVVFCIYISAFMYFAFCLQLTLTVKDSAVFRGLPRSGRKARQEFTLWDVYNCTAVQLYMWWFKFYLSAQTNWRRLIYDICSSFARIQNHLMKDRTCCAENKLVTLQCVILAFFLPSHSLWIYS